LYLKIGEKGIGSKDIGDKVPEALAACGLILDRLTQISRDKARFTMA